MRHKFIVNNNGSDLIMNQGMVNAQNITSFYRAFLKTIAEEGQVEENSELFFISSGTSFLLMG